jgi:hypothetical protein
MTNINGATYIPVLCVRPAEVNALRELPERDKDAFLPAIQLRPWMGAKQFSSALQKVQEVFGEKRQWIANIDSTYEPPAPKYDEETGKLIPPRQAVTDFSALNRPNNGYKNWCDLIEENQNLIPCLQLANPDQFDKQLERLASLNRGLVLHLTSLDDAPDTAQLSSLTEASRNNEILFIVDFGDIKNVQDLNSLIVAWIDTINNLYEAIPSCRIAISSTSFPSSFNDGIASKTIQERQLFNIALETSKQEDWNIVYSDRGSTRLNHKQDGGPPKIYARIDYPTMDTWHFFRADVGGTDYCLVAQNCMQAACWNPELHVWGTQMIERTAQGDVYAITSPSVATAVRVNIHLHNQLFYEQPYGLLDTDDDWID